MHPDYWKLVYYYFSVWKKNEIFEMLRESLVEEVRGKQGKRKNQRRLLLMPSQLGIHL